MKKLSLLFASMLYTLFSFSQTNIFPQDGNVGIGLTNPIKQLQIGNSSNYSAMYNDYLNTVNHMIFESKDSNDGGAFIFRSTQDSGTKDLLTINRFGSVGIGISNPTRQLQIGNSSNYSAMYNDYLNTVNHMIFESKDSNDGGAFIFRSTQDSGTKDLLTINRFGSVGISTTTTGTHKLAVNGTIGAREIKVEASAWSDFVFEDNYQLKDLEEVESYIEENKHLPDVPSEKEVLENGIQLGEMDAKLLQKIEELTLYLINQNKQLMKQSNEIQQLKTEIKKLKK
jgi:hypothetical protein